MENNTPNLIELEVLALTARRKPSFWKVLFGRKKEDSCCIILGSIAPESERLKLPIIIGKQEAMGLAVVIEDMTSGMPMTIDLFKTATDAFGYKLDSIIIDKLEEGIFHSTMRYSNGDKKVELHARVSDAVTMALKCKSPIYVVKELLERVGMPNNYTLYDF
jgi:uncharacterized protein